MELTPKEAEIFRELLSHHGIDTYRVEIVPEGKFLPGGSYPGEITMRSGEIITPTSLYEFWFDWVDGHYSLGEEDGLWKEIGEDIWSTTPYYDPDYTRKVQAQLRESISHES